KLIVTSRFEEDIRSVLSAIDPKQLIIPTGNAVDDNSNKDIRQYIDHRFANMAGRPSAPEDWPGKDVAEDLTRRACGIFIWAATALNYIEIVPDDERVRDVRDGSLPVGDVHALYQQVLVGSFSGWKDRERANVLDLLGAIMVVQIPLTEVDLACLLDMRPSMVEKICNKLRPILDGGNVLRFAHQSFVDFLIHREKMSLGNLAHGTDSDSDIFQVEPTASHYRLAESSFRCMNAKLRFNMCNIESSFLRNEALPPHQIDDAISCPLKYACRFWGFHLQYIPQQIEPDPLLVIAVAIFITEKLLFWLEALSVLGALNTAALALEVLSDQLKNLVRDAIRFTRYFAPVMAQSAPHIYMSSLAFTPTSSAIGQIYKPRLKNTIQLKCGQLVDWPAEESVMAPLEGHRGWVTSVAFSPDGGHIVSGSHDKTLQIWDAATGKSVTTPLEGHRYSVTSVAFSPDGKYIVSGSSDETIRIWDAMTGQSVVAPLEGHGDSVRSVAFSSDGKHIVSGSDDKTIRIWDAATGQSVMAPLEGHRDSVRSVAFSPDGKHIVSGSDNETIRIWAAVTEKSAMAPLRGHRDSVTSVAFSPDGKHVVSGSDDKTIRIWDAATGQSVVAPLEGHRGSVRSVAFSPDGRHIVSGSYDETIRIWDAATGKSAMAPLEGHRDWVTSVAFSPNGKHVVSGSHNKTIRIW
ncbi:WD40 repeat-like protein, partial [Obba rivulosa]